MDFGIAALYEQYRKDIYGYLVSLTHDKSLAEDLCSDVFVGAMISLPQFRGDADLKTWLFSIARHKWYEQIRRERRDASRLLQLGFYLQEAAPGAEQAVMREDLVQRALALLDEEKPAHKTILLMRAEGYSFHEIATRLTLSESSARVIDFRLRKKLRERLLKEGYRYESNQL